MTGDNAHQQGSTLNSSLLKALDLLTVFTAAEPRLPLTEISRRLGLPKSTTHRILATLQARGFIERLDNEDYALGMSLIALGQAVRVNVEVRDRAAPVARALAEQSQESVYVAVREGDHILYIYAIETSKRLVARTAIGDRVPLHCTGIGKASLAFVELREPGLVAAVNLCRFTDATITDPNVLRAELAVTRRRGYAIDRGEHEHGTFCTAAAFFDARGAAVGAISISGRDPDIIVDRLPGLSLAVTRAAAEISSRLGYVAPRPSAAPVLAGQR